MSATTATTRVRVNLLGRRPESRSRQISDIMSGIDRMNFRPVYQRGIRWKHGQMNALIKTIMDNGLVPGIIMYMLQDDDDTCGEQYDYEIVDGQHRLFSIQAFVSSCFIYLDGKKKGFIVYWPYKNPETGLEEHVFYKETEDNVNWARENNFVPHYLTKKEQREFDSFCLDVRVIECPLSMDQRRQIFMNLQEGVQVKNSDYLKNKTECGLVNFMAENNFESNMIDSFWTHCTRKVKNYYVQWVVRCFGLFKHYLSGTEYNDESMNYYSNLFVIVDSDLTKSIKTNHTSLNPTEEVMNKFHRKFTTFLEFLDKCGSNQFNPTQIYALFVHICHYPETIDVLLTHMSAFADEGSVKQYKSMWERHFKQDRREYFKKCLKKLQSCNEPMLNVSEQKINAEMRRKVWSNKFGDSISGQCVCGSIITLKKFDCGHIDSRARGGPVSEDNLRPICGTCNKKMGKRNMIEFFADEYPGAVSVL